MAKKKLGRIQQGPEHILETSPRIAGLNEIVVSRLDFRCLRQPA